MLLASTHPLLPVALPPLAALNRERLRAHGFQLNGDSLLAAPGCLRGADWSALAPALALAPIEDWLAMAARHLLGQRCSESTAFWQGIVAWADSAAAAIAMVPTAGQWEALWQR